MKTTIHAIIFDLGGVLLRTEDPAPRTELAEQYGLTRYELEDLVFGCPVAQQAERGAASAADVWADVARRLDVPPAEIPTLSPRFFGGDRVDFGLIALIQQLRPAYTTALLSNAWYPDLQRFISEDLHIPDTFDVIISSAASKMVKPGAEIYRLALQLTSARPEQAVFVDDNLRNIAGADALGIRTIRFTSPEQARCDLLALAPLP